MKKFIKFLVGAIAVGMLFLGSSANASVLQGFQGGTGFGSASSTAVGANLQVASTTPFLTYTFSSSSNVFTTTTINGLSATAYTFQTGTAGTDFTIATSGVATVTFNLPTASASNRGLLSTADWTTFNGKQNNISWPIPVASTSLSVVSPIILSTDQLSLSPTGYVSSTSAGTGISLSGSTGAVTITNIGVTSIVAGTNITVSNATGTVTVNSTGGSATSTFTFSSKNVTSGQVDGVGIFEASSTIKKVIITAAGGGSSLNTALQHYYKLEDNTDSTSTLTLTNNNVVTFGPGKVNNAAYFGASNTNKSLTSSTSPFALTGAFTGNWTMNAWVNVTTTPSSGNFMVAQSWGESASSTGGDIWYQNSAGTLQLKCNRARQNVADDGTLFNQTLTNGTWFMITCTYDGTNIRSYVNGVLKDTTAASGNGNTGSNITAIGVYHGGAGQFWSGEVDEAGYWNQALSQVLINNLYNNGAGRTMPFLQTNVSIGLGYTTSTISTSMTTSTMYNLLSSTNNIIDSSVMNCFALATSTACPNPIDGSSTPSGLDSLYLWNNGLTTSTSILTTVFYTQP